MVYVPEIIFFSQLSSQKLDYIAYLKYLIDVRTTSEKTGDKPVEHLDEHDKFAIISNVSSILPIIITEVELEGLQGIQFFNKNVSSKEVIRKINNRSNSIHSEDSISHMKLLIDVITTSGKTGENSVEDSLTQLKLVCGIRTSPGNTEKEPKERHKNTQASEGSANRPIHHTDIRSDDHCITLDSQEDNSTGMRGSMVDENWCKVQAEQIPSSEANTDISSNESMSAVESTRIRLYRNVIRNETSRMMSSIDMVMSEAKHLFGLERSRILFQLLTTELCHFGSTGAISEFVPNMAESIVRQNVISFFEHASDMMNILMTMLLSCPDSNGLQQMPEQDFISVLKPIIQSLLKTKTKGREKLSLEEKKYSMVDPKEFAKELGVVIPEDVLIRLKSGDEMVVHRFVDTRLERHQPSDRGENMTIHSIYFPSDYRLFICIPTENGIYWHQLDMRRADRISRHG